MSKRLLFMQDPGSEMARNILDRKEKVHVEKNDGMDCDGCVVGLRIRPDLQPVGGDSEDVHRGGRDMSVFEVGEEGAFLEQDHDEIPS
jgi:hypothetical protein